jgi:membrane-bound serine protease (ClpP class)
MTGVALSDLRPSGYARIGNRRVDVVTRGDYIATGEPIEVIADEGYRRVVRRVAQRDAGTPGAEVSDSR